MLTKPSIFMKQLTRRKITKLCTGLVLLMKEDFIERQNLMITWRCGNRQVLMVISKHWLIWVICIRMEFKIKIMDIRFYNLTMIKLSVIIVKQQLKISQELWTILPPFTSAIKNTKIRANAWNILKELLKPNM